MLSHHPANFGGHRHCGNGDMFLVAKKENSRCSSFNPPLPFISKGHGLKSTRQTNSDPGHTRSKQQLDIYLQLIFDRPSKSTDKEKKKKKESQLQSVLRYTQTQKMNHKIASCKNNFSIKNIFLEKTAFLKNTSDILGDFKNKKKFSF